ncbi:hypothetical protein, partial [Halobacillus litoralis]|uniref:hypothetical protein n=1 Tax=Halobacillus litoralis TaxID=45668 RepID=UPI001F282796
MKSSIKQTGTRDKFCYKRFFSVKGRKFICLNFNCTTEDGNEGSMFPETIPSTLLHALRRTGL